MTPYTCTCFLVAEYLSGRCSCHAVQAGGLKAGVQYRQLSIGPNAQHKNQVYKQLRICTADHLDLWCSGRGWGWGSKNSFKAIHIVFGWGSQKNSRLSNLYLEGRRGCLLFVWHDAKDIYCTLAHCTHPMHMAQRKMYNIS